MRVTSPTVEPSGMYNQKQAAEALGISRHTLRRYAKKGLIKCHARTINRGLVFFGSEIIECWRNVYVKKMNE